MPNHRVYKTCHYCRQQYYGENDKFCSNRCYLKFHAAKILVCKRCGKGFKGKRHKQKYCSQDCRYKARRKPDRDKRGGYKYKKWVIAVFERDNYTCQKCGNVGKIHAHHVKEWKDYPSLRYVVSNGLTLCQECHSIVHGKNIHVIKERYKPVCEDCGKMTKGHSRYCRGCALKRSPKAIAQRDSIKRGADGVFIQS